MKNQPCPKTDCMYLHDMGKQLIIIQTFKYFFKHIKIFVGEPEASFTKDEMQQGKHQEYEKKLYEQYNVALRYVIIMVTTNSKYLVFNIYMLLKETRKFSSNSKFFW